ncbi:MAG: CHAT domain-containing protein [Prolixibacteraceae bacterium]
MKTHFILTASIVFLVISLATKEIAHANKNQDSLIFLANNLTSEGSIQLSGNNYAKAESYFMKSIATWEQVEEYNEYSSYPFFQLANLYRMTGAYDKSILNYNLAEKILLNASDDYVYLLGGLYATLGYFYYVYGDYQKSFDYYNRASELIEPFKYSNENLYANAVLGTAQYFYAIKKYEDAKQIIEKYLKENNPNNLSFKQLLGNIYIEENNLDQAIQELLYVTHGLKNDNIRYAQATLTLGKAYLKNNNLNEAEKCFASALTLLEANFSTIDPWMVYYYEIYGQFLMKKAEHEPCDYNKLANYTEAVNVFDKALLANSQMPDNKIPYLEGKGELITPAQVKDVFINRTMALNQIGKLYESQNDRFTANVFYDKALKSADATILFLHDLRISFLQEESKISLTEQYDKVYLEGFKIAENLYENTQLPNYFEQMLNFSESGKSATFLASLNDIKAKNFGGIPDSLVQQERNITMQLSNLKQLKFNEQNNVSPDSILVNELEKSIFNLQNKHDELIFLFERDYADYFDFKYRNITISSNDILKKLQQNQTLVEYFVDEPESASDTGYVYALTFNSSGESYHKTVISYEYVLHLQNIISELTNNNIGDINLDHFNRYTSAANYLFNVLIKPLGLNEKVSDLIIIPDGRMAYIPFDALIRTLPKEERIDYRNLDYLVYDYNITYSYSATLHFDYFKSNKKKGRNILAFSPTYTNEDVDLNKSAYRNRQINRNILRPLPGAKDEVIGLSKFQKCTALFGADASETNFKLKAGNFDILHLAMHTIINDSIPMFSKLVFSSPNDTINDGYLNTQEIYNLKLDARLAVLSACNTGSGKMRTGEGVMSLSRAFLYAGCPSIVMTLWEVEDKVSAELMLNFYRYLFKGFTKPEALRKAKIDHIKQSDPLKSHPYFWQGYILIGDPSPIKFNNNVLISLLIFSAILFILWHFIRKYYFEKKRRSSEK